MVLNVVVLAVSIETWTYIIAWFNTLEPIAKVVSFLFYTDTMFSCEKDGKFHKLIKICFLMVLP
jgi:hypothetical protein